MRLCAAEEQLAPEVAELLREAERVDAEEDRLYGKERRGDELPEELRRRESRLEKIRAAKEALEREAKERAERAATEARERVQARKANEAKRGKRYGGRPPVIPDPETATPGPPEQKNFTDPESRIMVDGASGSYVQAYNAHAAVDATLPGHRGRFSHPGRQRQAPSAAAPQADRRGARRAPVEGLRRQRLLQRPQSQGSRSGGGRVLRASGEARAEVSGGTGHACEARQ